jgi:hypothetical protein
MLDRMFSGPTIALAASLSLAANKMICGSWPNIDLSWRYAATVGFGGGGGGSVLDELSLGEVAGSPAKNAVTFEFGWRGKQPQ